MKKQKGFSTVKKLLIVAVVFTLAILTYNSHTKRVKKAEIQKVHSDFTKGISARFHELKPFVEACARKLMTVVGCSGNTNGIPGNTSSINGDAITVSNIIDGVITFTLTHSRFVGTNNIGGISIYQHTLILDDQRNLIEWTLNRSCVGSGITC